MSCVTGIFTIAGIFAVEVEEEDKLEYSCCGKVQVLDHNTNRELIGYVISKSQTWFVFQLNDLDKTII